MAITSVTWMPRSRIVIKVLFFAQLRELLQCDTCEVPLPAPATIAGLRDYLMAMNPTWAEHLSNQ